MSARCHLQGHAQQEKEELVLVRPLSPLPVHTKGVHMLGELAHQNAILEIAYSSGLGAGDHIFNGWGRGLAFTFFHFYSEFCSRQHDGGTTQKTTHDSKPDC